MWKEHYRSTALGAFIALPWPEKRWAVFNWKVGRGSLKKTNPAWMCSDL